MLNFIPKVNIITNSGVISNKKSPLGFTSVFYLDLEKEKNSDTFRKTFEDILR